MKNSLRRAALAATILSASVGAILSASQAPVVAQAQPVETGTRDASGTFSLAPRGAALDALRSLKLDAALKTPRSVHIARFDASRGTAPDRRTPAQRLSLGKYLIATNRATTRFVPYEISTPRSAAYLASLGATGTSQANVAARLGQSLAFARQLAFYARLSPDDIADAMTLSALMSYQAATGRRLSLFTDNANTRPRDLALLRGVRAQMRQVAGRDPHLQGMDAPQKRFVGELHQMLAALMALPATSDAAKSRDARLVYQFVTGNPASSARLSANGFSPAPRLTR